MSSTARSLSFDISGINFSRSYIRSQGGTMNFTDGFARKNKVNYNLFTQKERKSRMELLIPGKIFERPNFQTEKIKRTLTELGKVFNSNNVPLSGFINRPILNLNRNEFDFSPRNLIFPSSTNKVMITAPSHRKHPFLFKGIDDKKRIELRNSHFMQNTNAHNTFMKDLEKIK